MGLEFTVKDLKLLGGVDEYASHKKKIDDMKDWQASPFKDDFLTNTSTWCRLLSATVWCNCVGCSDAVGVVGKVFA